MRGTKIFAGSSHPELAQAIVDKLGMTLAPVHVKTHANHEKTIELGVSVRNQDVFIIQSGSDNINDDLMELLILVNSARSSSARRITAVIPFLPYSKQSKKKKSRGAITAKLIANMLTVAGVDHIITMDLHSDQMQGFFSKPVDNLLSEPLLCKYIREHVRDFRDAVVVSKNAGGVSRVTSLSDRLKLDFALIHQDNTSAVPPPVAATNGFVKPCTATRLPPTDSLAEIEVIAPEWHEDGLQLVGDVHGRPCFVVDDVLDKPATFIAVAQLLLRRGATRVMVLATHGILSSDALAQMEQCDAIHDVIVTNTYPIAPEKRQMSSKLRIMDASAVFAEAIRRTHNGESISYLFHTSL
ncbi:hypothetical protein GGF31_000333 [Allomyces arbusculus]|nr:hypothetical protein GGF31_000333 [Allomyces arbusculus]